MEHYTSMTSLMIVVGIAFLLPIILHRLRLKVIPVVVAEIIAGIIIGKSGLNIISQDPWLELLSLLGFIFLMFLSGLEIDFSFLTTKSKVSIDKSKAKVNPNPLLVSCIIFACIFAVSFVLSYLFMLLGFIDDIYIMTLIISTISLGVVVPVLKEKKMMRTNYGQTILLIAVISDFATIVLLAVYVALLSEDATNALWILLLFAVVFLSYFFIRFLYQGRLFQTLRTGTVQLGTRAVFALILFFVALSETLGAENILGAFLAGVIVSLLSPQREFVRQLDSFGYGFLIPIFFVMVGVNLDLLALFNESMILIFIPFLVIALFISKLIPVLLLKKWYSWNQVIGAAFLLTSTLSLVIAASTIALNLGLIDETLHSSLIVVAIITCLFAPILFNKFVPKAKRRKEVASIIGTNGITLPVSLDLLKDGYEVKVFGGKQNRQESNDEAFQQSSYPIIELPLLTKEELNKQEAFHVDVFVLGTSYDDLNIELARHAKELGVPRIIIRVENIELHQKLREEGFIIFSTVNATRTLLKALIETPSAIRLMTQHDESIQELEIQNPVYNRLLLRHLPFLGDTLILRIYRRDSYIIPHGDTSLRLGDRILVSGSLEHIQAMKNELQ